MLGCVDLGCVGVCGCGLCRGVWVWTVAVLGCVGEDCGCVGVCGCGLCRGVWVWTV